MPISKQRNKHIQRVLIEAAKLATRESPELAMIRARELEKGNPNRATLAVARKMVIYMLAVERRQQDFVPAETVQPHGGSVKPFLIRERQNIGIHERAGCQVPPIADWAKEQNSGGSLRIVSGLAENTNSIICDGSSEPETANGCPVLHGMQGPPAVRHSCAETNSRSSNARSPERAQRPRVFS